MSRHGAPVARAGAGVAAVAAEGTDPEVLLAVLGWVVGPRRSADALRRACRDHGRPGDAPAELLRAAAGDPDRQVRHAVDDVVARWREVGARVALVGDPAYPRRLAAGWPHSDAPVLLAWQGEPCDDRPAVAIVGARRATGYGAGVAAWLAGSVARAGVRVVSGGAVGIDAAAHGAALDEAGGTTVVLGCGHAVGYPRVHAAPGGLFDRVLGQGGTLVSELLPQGRPVAGHVRARNRIVAGLGDAVVVVEGSARSGALVTATAAAERGVPVLAVPGDVRAPGSAAPHRLLAEGAAPCTEPADVLAAVVPPGAPGAGGAAPGRAGVPGGAGVPGEPPGPAGSAATLVLPEDVRTTLAAAWPRPMRVDDLAAATGRPAAVLLATLTRARLAGEVADGPDGVRLRRAP